MDGKYTNLFITFCCVSEAFNIDTVTFKLKAECFCFPLDTHMV